MISSLTSFSPSFSQAIQLQFLSSARGKNKTELGRKGWSRLCAFSCLFQIYLRISHQAGWIVFFCCLLSSLVIKPQYVNKKGQPEPRFSKFLCYQKLFFFQITLSQDHFNFWIFSTSLFSELYICWHHSVDLPTSCGHALLLYMVKEHRHGKEWSQDPALQESELQTV